MEGSANGGGDSDYNDINVEKINRKTRNKGTGHALKYTATSLLPPTQRISRNRSKGARVHFEASLTRLFSVIAIPRPGGARKGRTGLVLEGSARRGLRRGPKENTRIFFFFVSVFCVVILKFACTHTNMQAYWAGLI